MRASTVANPLQELLKAMVQQRQGGEFRSVTAIDPTTDAGQIAAEYNRVLERVNAEIQAREREADRARRAEAKYRSIFDNAIEGIFQTTPEGAYLSANSKLAQIYGYDSPDELISGINDIRQQLYVESGRRDEFRRLIQEQRVVTEFESQVYRRDGSMIWISENARGVHDDQGRLLYYEGTVEDITARKRADEWRTEKEAAIAASLAKSEFLAHMSHEIRTPLNGVIGMLELLGMTPMNEPQERYVRIARSSAATLLSLINDVLDFSKIEAGKLDLEQIDFSLPTLLEEIEEMFSHRASAKGLRLDRQIDAQLPAVVRGDPERLRQVLINLTSNALKFTARGGVELVVRLAGEREGRPIIRFEVRDTGIGISADRISELFSAFNQLDASTNRKFGGTGLGLAICKKIVELMGGQIACHSVVDRGSTFWLEVPLERAAFSERMNVSDRTGQRSLPGRACATAVPMETSPGLIPQMPIAPIHLLVAEDNEINQQVARELLLSAGYTCDLVANGREAIEAIRRGGYHLVLMDCQMPGLDGFGAARQSRELESEGVLPHAANGPLPIVALTASAIQGDRERCLSAGMNDYATKPIDRNELVEKVTRWTKPSGRLSKKPSEKAPDRSRVVANCDGAIDYPRLLSRCAGDATFAHELLNRLRIQLPDDSQQLTEVLARGDVERARLIAHTLKGVAGNLAAAPLERTARAFELALSSPSASLPYAPLKDLQAEIDRCLNAAEALLDLEARAYPAEKASIPFSSVASA